MKEGKKVRVSAKTGLPIPKPVRDDLKHVNRTKDKKQGEQDTNPEDVLEKTYKGEDFVSIFNEFNEFIRVKEEKERLISLGTNKKWMA